MKYNIKTDIHDNAIIVQELHCEFQDIATRTARWVIDTRDSDIKKALIKLGWTPPEHGMSAVDRIEIGKKVARWLKNNDVEFPVTIINVLMALDTMGHLKTKKESSHEKM